jgi:hypothetical protein
MISFRITVELSEGDFGNGDDQSADEGYEPSFNLSIQVKTLLTQMDL